MILRTTLLSLTLTLSILPGEAGAQATRSRLPHSLLVVEAPPRSPGGLGADPSKTMRSELCRGAQLVRYDPDGSRSVLAPEMASVCEPSISHDGQSVLFSGQKQPNDPWDVFELGVDGKGLRQITRRAGNCRSPIYLSTYYVITADEPWPQILFVSDAASEINEDGHGAAWDLYSCRTDGSEVQRLTFNPSSDFDPFLVWDGRVLFSSWQRSMPRHGPHGRVRLFNMNIDGTDLVPLTGEQGLRVQQMAAVTARGTAVFVEADRIASDGAGRLSRVLLRRPLHTYRVLTRESDGLFHSPSPLPDGAVLVSRRAPEGTGTFDLYRFDPESEQLELLIESRGKHLIYAKALVEGKRPDGRSSVVNDNTPVGQFYCLDLSINDLKFPLMDAARRVRVLEGLPIRRGNRSPSNSPLLEKRFLGEIPIESDGSFFIEVPANTPIQLQVLDENGMALRSCGWIWVRNKEPRGCIGCHEDGELVPENRFVEAVRKPPTRLSLPEGRRRFVDFRRDVAPLTARACTADECHNGAGSAPDLTAPEGGPGEPEYVAKIQRVLLSGLEDEGSMIGRWVHPGAARTSPLIWHLLGHETSRPWDQMSAHAEVDPIPMGGRPLLSAGDLATLVEWIDLGAHGDSEVLEAVRHNDRLPSGGNQ